MTGCGSSATGSPTFDPDWPAAETVRRFADVVVARLEWEFELQEKGFQVETFLERGMRPPAWYLSEPVVDDGVRTAIEAFWSCSTERQVGQAIGPVPDSAIEAFGARRGLDPATMVVLRHAIRACDAAYFKWAEKRRKRAQGKSGN